MKPARVLAVLALAAATTAGAVAALRPGKASSPPATASLPEAPAGATPGRASEAAGVPRPQRASGSYRRYAIDSRVVMTNDGSAPAASASPTLRLQGTWQETVAKIADGRVTLIIAFTPSETAPGTLSRADLARPFVVELGEDDGVSSVVFARGVSGDARQALRALVAQTQLTRAATGEARRWQAAEEDTTGQYRALYKATSSTEIERRKGPYAQVVSSRGLGPAADDASYDVDSLTRYRLDGSGAIVEIGLRESLRVVTGAETPTLRALAILDLRLTEQGRGPVPAVEVGRRERLASLTAEAGSDAVHDVKMARGADFPTLLSRLSEIDRMEAQEGRRAAAKAIPQARAVLRLSPDAAAEAGRVLADPRTSPVTAGILGAALAAAETDEARKALLDLARSDDATARAAGVRHLTLLRNADDESVDTLKSLLGDEDASVAGAAGLALGANIRQAGGAESSEANASALAELIARYHAASDDATRIHLLYALGNAGDRAVLPIMVDAIGRGPSLGAAATYGLRFVPGADVDQLFDSLLHKGAEWLRLAAVNAVLVRDRAAWLPRLQALLQGELPEAVRRAIFAAT
jgi:hypothetical protein